MQDRLWCWGPFKGRPIGILTSRNVGFGAKFIWFPSGSFGSIIRFWVPFKGRPIGRLTSRKIKPKEPDNRENTLKMNQNKSRRSRDLFLTPFRTYFLYYLAPPPLLFSYLLFLGRAPSCPPAGLFNHIQRPASQRKSAHTAPIMPESIGFGAMGGTKPYIFIGFGAMGGTKPYKFISPGPLVVEP